jgi:hypothetical protein
MASLYALCIGSILVISIGIIGGLQTESATVNAGYTLTEGTAVYSSTDRCRIGSLPECQDVFAVLSAGQVTSCLLVVRLV